MQKMSAEEIQEQLAEFGDWSLTGDRLQRTFKFESFTAAVAFVNRVAALAEEHDHHPDIMIRSGKVTLTLSTSDAGGLTALDFEFARSTDGIFQVV